MRSTRCALVVLLLLAVCGVHPTSALADGVPELTSAPAETSASTPAAEAPTSIESVVQVQQYNRAIHVMAMLLVGFGFLMVFVRKYGRSALTATYLLVSTALPLYFLLSSTGAFGGADEPDVVRLLLAEFAAASLLICAGAVLGRLKMWQYIVLGAMFIPAYLFNEWVVLHKGLGLVENCMDTGGSIVIHMFGAVFGFGVMLSMTTPKEFETEIESDETSDRYSLLGSMVLWVFWPSFCGALVAPGDVPHTAINVILALSGSTLATYIATVTLRKKISPADIANAALAGGVAIGSLCDQTDFFAGAFILGITAGVLSTVGFAVIQSKLEGLVKKADTCGVMYPHGLPGILGGLSAVFFVDSPSAQVLAIVVSIAVALVAGAVAGKVLSLLGRRAEPYTDAEEILAD